MTTVFVDSSAWLGLILPRDRNNAKANLFFHSLDRATQFFTTNYVLSETFTWLRYREPFQTVDALDARVRAALQLRLLEIAWIDEATHEEAWTTMKTHPGMRLSFCDCSSFVVCRRRRIEQVFTFDSDFRTMGFDVRPGP